MLDAKTVSVLKLFRDSLRLADYLGHKVRPPGDAAGGERGVFSGGGG